MTRSYVTALLTTCAVLAAAVTAQAGGFSRGTADTDILFEDANFNMRTGMAFVMPRRGFATVTAPDTPLSTAGGLVRGQKYKSTDDDYTQDYAVPSMAVKFNIAEDLRCAGTYTQPFGADSVYGPQAVLFGAAADGTGTMNEQFETNEFGATCGYKFDLEKGRAWLIGGAFLQDFSYSQQVKFVFGAPDFLVPLPRNTTATLSFEDQYRAGFRLGAAYEIPEIALRAQILYRSEVNHSPGGGQNDNFSVVLPNGIALPALATAGSGTLPQSVELKLQSGIAPGWLGFGSVKWTDWSVLDKLDYTIEGLGPQELEYYFRDGWTVTAGVGHSFTEEISGVMGLTWDRGVSTTEDTLSDVYTVAAGMAFKDKIGGEVRFGGAISYLTAASVSAQAGAGTPGVEDPGAAFGYSVDGDWTYAFSAGYKVNW